MDFRPSVEKANGAEKDAYDPGDARELELELTRIRAEARAARLEARAAEIELMLRRSAKKEDPITNAPQVTAIPDAAAIPASRINSWSELLEAAKLEAAKVLSVSDLDRAPQALSPSMEVPAAPEKLEEPQEEISLRSPSEVLPKSEFGPQESAGDSIGSPEPSTARVGAPASKSQSGTTSVGAVTNPSVEEKNLRFDLPTHVKENRHDVESSTTASAVTNLAPRPKLLDFPTDLFEAGDRLERIESAAVVRALEQSGDDTSEEEQERPGRRRPAPWILSIVAHAAVLMVLAGMTLSVNEPQDQIALSATSAQPAEEQVETMVLEQTEQPETNSESQAETITTVNPLGDIAAAVVDVTGPGIPDVVANPGDSLSKMLGQSISSGGSPGDMSATFFGASGGGNHFVYLVDSSGSMDQISRDGFDVARAEVLRAVDTLNEEQRFYVVFFGEETLKMRLGNAAEPEPRSVYATEENKRALRRWASTLSMQPGRWPKEALTFAFKLRPDCIFLLTDGAMPDYVPEMVRSNNIVETLLDGPKPRSIIHTIGFHNPEGEAILSKIAKENGGTYHFVPPNANSRR